MFFKDDAGNAWKIKLTIGILEEIDEVVPTFSTSIVRDTEKLMNLLWTDPQKMVMILWVLCEDQANAKNVTPKQFGRLFNRDVLDRASDCLITEFITFFQPSPVGEKLKKSIPEMLERFKTRAEKIVDKAIIEASSKLDTI